MTVSFTNTTGVFLFIIFCSVYVCSILWIYGDAATRDMGHKGLILPFLFIAIGTLALIREGLVSGAAAMAAGLPVVVHKTPEKIARDCGIAGRR